MEKTSAYRPRGERAPIEDTETPIAATGELVPTKADLPTLQLSVLERIAIFEALRQSNGSTSKAAKLLGISVRKVQYRLREWKASSSDFALGEKYNLVEGVKA